jgi:hypothetical protein
MILDEQEILFMKCPFCNKETESPMIVPDYCESCGTVYILSEADIEELRPFIIKDMGVDIDLPYLKTRDSENQRQNYFWVINQQ